MLKFYLQKMKGGGKTPPMASLSNIFWSFIGAFSGIASLHFSTSNSIDTSDINMVIGSFGASAVLVYGQSKVHLPNHEILLAGM